MNPKSFPYISSRNHSRFFFDDEKYYWSVKSIESWWRKKYWSSISRIKCTFHHFCLTTCLSSFEKYDRSQSSCEWWWRRHVSQYSFEFNDDRNVSLWWWWDQQILTCYYWWRSCVIFASIWRVLIERIGTRFPRSILYRTRSLFWMIFFFIVHFQIHDVVFFYFKIMQRILRGSKIDHDDSEIIIERSEFDIVIFDRVRLLKNDKFW